MGNLARIGDVNNTFNLKKLPKELHEQALGLRRLCLEKMAEITVQGAHVGQYEADAKRSLRKAKESDDAGRTDDAEWHRAQAKTLMANAAHSRERCKQANMELDFIINRGILNG